MTEDFIYFSYLRLFLSHMTLIQIFLYPLSLLYGSIMALRNILFDLRIIPSRKHEIPLIGIGNLSFGGTGKTPHIEYLVRLLKKSFSVATLSRGYGRRTKGFLLGSGMSDAKSIGDEPLQIAKKFDSVKVAVDEQRNRGVENLSKKYPDLDVILLDDVFQHRFIRPGLNILLTDYNCIYHDDHVAPSGRLREFACGARRADIIVVTKTPKVFSPITRRKIIEEINPNKNQQLFFSYIRYMDPVPVFKYSNGSLPQKTSYVLLVSGIANDSLLCEHVKRTCSDLTLLRYSDHHVFTNEDLENIRQHYLDLPTQKKIIITTEKDAMRFRSSEAAGTILKDLPLFYIPIETDFHGSDKTIFDKMILNYVEKNSRNRRLSVVKNHYSS
ncbi:MAG: tetraacyldisaccharide 4'-kinase [Bacteroidota bacterium]|nr:tetraacyldisaccharide 4'-kinase [Bacteroidota bacterium]